MKLTVSAPARIDLAGATLDIYPLYLFLGGALTLNAAIDRCSQVQVGARADGKIRIEGRDLNASLAVDALTELEGHLGKTPLDLVLRVLTFYRPSRGLDIRIESDLPAGSGLGGSSAMLIALSTALVQMENLPFNKEELVDIGARIEAQSIGVPTGMQDHLAAAHGGFNAFWFGLRGARRERLVLSSSFRETLQSRLLLGYSGASRFSGHSNWAVVKNFIDGRQSTVSRLRQIKETTLAMYESLRDEDLDSLSSCLAQEWKSRSGLARGLATPELNRIFKSAGSRGALASKVCGAGGGGCFITLVREGKREAVSEAIRAEGGSLLDYRFSEYGVRVLE